MSIVQEEWKAVPGWEGFYEVSNLGRVRSVARVVDTAYGGKQARPGRIRQASQGTRYLHVTMTGAGRRTTKPIHTLVARAFLGVPPAGYQVNHIDGDRQNNVLANLEYVTPKENSVHAHRLGLSTPTSGEKHAAAVLTETDVRRIRANPAGLTFPKLAVVFGVSLPTIYDVVTRRSWRHL